MGEELLSQQREHEGEEESHAGDGQDIRGDLRRVLAWFSLKSCER